MKMFFVRRSDVKPDTKFYVNMKLEGAATKS